VLLGYERFNFSPSELIPFILNQTKPQKQNKTKKIITFTQLEQNRCFLPEGAMEDWMLWRCNGEKVFFYIKKEKQI
jgi:hypothetical protein